MSGRPSLLFPNPIARLDVHSPTHCSGELDHDYSLSNLLSLVITEASQSPILGWGFIHTAGREERREEVLKKEVGGAHWAVILPSAFSGLFSFALHLSLAWAAGTSGVGRRRSSGC